MTKIFCDGITNLALPEKADLIYLSNHKIPGNLYAVKSKIAKGLVMSGFTTKRCIFMKDCKIGRYLFMESVRVEDCAYMPNLSVGADAYMRELSIGGDLRMDGFSVGNSAYMTKMSVGRFALMPEIEVGEELDMSKTRIKRLLLTTKKGTVIPYLCLDGAVIEDIEADILRKGGIAIKELSKKGAKLPKSLEEALERGLEFGKKLSNKQTK